MEELNVQAMASFFKMYCEDQGISVTIDPNCDVPKTSSSGGVVLPRIDPFNVMKTIAQGFHEAGHHHKDVKWALNMYQDLEGERVTDTEKNVVNMLLDHLNERNGHGVYRGRDRIIAKHREETISSNPNMLKAVGQEMPIEAALMAHDIESRQEWQSKDLSLGTGLEGQSKEYYDVLKKLKLDSTMEHILETKDEDALRKLVQSVLDVVDMESQAGQGGGDGDGEGSEGGEQGDCQECDGSGHGDSDCDECGDGCDSCDGSGKEPCEACDGTGKEQGQGEGQGQGQGEVQRDANQGSDSKDGEGQEAEGGGGIGASGADYGDPQSSLDSYTNSNPSESPEYGEGTKDYRRDFNWSSSKYMPSDLTKVTWIKMKDEARDPNAREVKAVNDCIGSSNVSKQIQRYLKVMATDTFEYGKKRGKIHQKNIHRIYSAKQGNIAQPAIFKQKNASRLVQDTAFMILQDCSGSMQRGAKYGTLYTTASACSIAIAETLRDLRISHEMFGFTDASSGIIMFEYKTAGEKNVSRDNLIERYCKPRNMGCNADGESLLLVAERLMAMKEKNKWLIVLSDGEPACSSGSGDSNMYLKKVCKLIEDESPINLIGIGICSHSVKRYYKNHEVVDDVSKLDSVLVPLVRDALLGS